MVAPAERIQALWNKLWTSAGLLDIKPAGLGARDTFRTEVCYPLYGHELDEETTPIEAGLAFFVALDKGDFMGRHVLAEQKNAGPTKKLIAFKMTARCAPPRAELSNLVFRPGAPQNRRKSPAEPKAPRWASASAWATSPRTRPAPTTPSRLKSAASPRLRSSSPSLFIANPSCFSLSAHYEQANSQ